jgi:DNA-binding MarR family transcriptional regulator
MKIDEAIQSRFRNDRHRAGVNLMYTSNWLSDQVGQSLKNHGLTLQQFNLLRIIRGAAPQPVSVKYIRERMLDKMSDVSRVVEKLREKQLIDRRECPSDRRNVDITLTKAGAAKLQEVDTRLDTIDHVFNTLTDLEVEQFNALLDKLRG